MKDTTIKGSGNSRSMKTVPNAPIIYPDFATFIQEFASNGIPFDMGPLNLTGVLEKGTDLNKSTLLTDATAAIVGFDSSAVPNDVLAALSNYALSGAKLAQIKVLDEDGNPFPGVTLSGVQTPDGQTAVTNDAGTVLVKVPSTVSVTFSTDYLDVQPVTQSIGPSADKIVNAYTVTLPFVEAGYIAELKTSGTYKVWKEHNATVCCAGGGQNGTSGGRGGTGTGNGGTAGTGGEGGKIINQNLILSPDTNYDAVVASSGGTTTFGTVSSANGTTDTLALNDEAYRNKIGGKGANGGTGGKGYYNNATSGGNSTTAGGGGGGGGGGYNYNATQGGGSGGSSTYGSPGSSGSSNNYPGSGGNGGSGGRGGNGGPAGGGGGGGGGGVGGGNSGDSPGSGGSGGAGGPGIILVKLLD